MEQRGNKTEDVRPGMLQPRFSIINPGDKNFLCLKCGQKIKITGLEKIECSNSECKKAHSIKSVAIRNPRECEPFIMIQLLS